MFSQPMSPMETLGYWKARAGQAEDKVDDLTAENERLRAAAQKLAKIITPNDKGYSRCLACTGLWHTGNASEHFPRCPVLVVLAE
jgi:hypothetical protein